MVKNWLSKKITRGYQLEFIKKHCSSKRTLDLGSSKSPYSEYFPNRTSCDIEKREGVDVVADAHKLPFEDSEFSVIVCTEVLEHLHSPHIAIKEMHRVLEPGGTLLLTTRFVFPIHDAPHDYYRYTEFGMKHLFKDGWSIESIEPETRNFETIAVLVQRIGYQTTLRGGIFTKAIVLLSAKFISSLGWLVIKESGINDPDRSYPCNIFASGYFLKATKK
jgi:SAM-dependent methyltransferase